jgi:uncharacterized damage-inducible protein DinB
MAKRKSTASRNTKRKINKKRLAAAKSSSADQAAQSAARLDKSIREQLLKLLGGGQAHADFDAAMGDWPVQLAAVKVANFPHTAWMLLEHIRIAQWDILEFSRNPKHKSPPWPEGYWPKSEAPADDKAWKASMAEAKKVLRSFQQLVANPKTDLYAKIPWGDGQTILREALLVADHNSYHIGQLVMLRKCLGI